MTEKIEAVDIDLLTEIDNEEELSISDIDEQEIIKPVKQKHSKINYHKLKIYIALILILIFINLPVINNWSNSLPTSLHLVIKILLFLFVFTIFDRLIDC